MSRAYRKVEAVESAINEHAAQGYRVVCAVGSNWVIMELAETASAPKPAASEAWGRCKAHLQAAADRNMREGNTELSDRITWCIASFEQELSK